MVDYSRLPPHLREGIKQYVEAGIEPGRFWKAALADKLHDAVVSADPETLTHLLDVVHFMYWELPSSLWGSKQVVEAWINTHQVERAVKTSV